MYIPVIISADRRYRAGMTPLRLQNMHAQPVPTDAGKPVRAALIPSAGRVTRLDLGSAIQGIYAESGVRSGGLFAVAGGALYSISSSWVATFIGPVGSADAQAVFAGLRDKLYVACGGQLYGYDGAAFIRVSDPDVPTVTSMVVLAQRLIVSELNADTMSWSDTLDGTDFDALGFSTAEQRPDPVRSLMRISGQLVAGGAASLEVLRPTGDNTLPFANVANQSIDETDGLLSANSWAVRGDKAFMVGGNYVVYQMAGFSVQPLNTNAELEAELRALTEGERARVTCFAYTEGTHEFFVIRMPGRPAYVYDNSTQLWHTRLSWEAGEYSPRWYARAYGYDVLADDGGSVISTLSPDALDDAGGVIERVVTLRVPGGDYAAIGSICFDIQAFARPAAGQGSSPTLMIDISGNARDQRDDTRAEIMLTAGPDGTYIKPTLWGVGLMAPAEGLTITIRWTDPAGITFYGAWINEGQK